MPCQLCGRWVDTSVPGQDWRDHGVVSLVPWSLWPRWGSYYYGYDGHIWTVAHLECARALRLFAFTPVLLNGTGAACSQIEELDKQLRLLRADLYGGRAARHPGLRERLDQADEQVVRLRRELWRLDDLVGGVSDALVHNEGGVDPVREYARMLDDRRLPPPSSA